MKQFDWFLLMSSICLPPSSVAANQDPGPSATPGDVQVSEPAGKQNDDKSASSWWILLPIPGSKVPYGDGLAKSSAVVQDMDIGIAVSDMSVSDEAEKDQRGLDFFILPIPISNPTYGTGLAAAGLLFYDLGASSQASVTALGGFKTSSGTQGIGLYQRTNFSGDKYKINLAVGSARLFYDFYGVGNEAGDSGLATPVRESKLTVNLDATMRIVANIYVGPKYRLVNSTVAIRHDDMGDSDDVDPANGQIAEQDVTIAGLGATLRYDTRDNAFNPAKGWLGELEFLQNDPAFGSDIKYQSFQAKINYYHRLSSNQVLATRLLICSVSDAAPVSELCQFGKGGDLRGYTGGQYRDTSLFAAQAEYRWQFHNKFGMVIFGGFGAVSSGFGHLLDHSILPSGGAGIRYMVSEKFKVNLSLDYAIGKNSQAIYFRVGEVF